jgi:hypothetical protein
MPTRRPYCYKDTGAFHILSMLRQPANWKFLFKDKVRGGGCISIPD